jgi:hypothetical protein
MESEKEENTLTDSTLTNELGEEKKNEGLQLGNLSSSKSLKDLDGERQIEYWKNRALKAIQANKELTMKIEELQNDLTTFTRRADRYEKRAERFSRALQSFKTDNKSLGRNGKIVDAKEYIDKFVEAFSCQDTRTKVKTFIGEYTFDDDEWGDDLTECSTDSSYKSNAVVNRRT